MAITLNSFGLLLDIIGALILLKYGLPPQIDPRGHIHLITEQVDEGEIQTAKRYKLYSKIGVWLLVVGFSLQLISNCT